jgi:hypothetical protein
VLEGVVVYPAAAKNTRIAITPIKRSLRAMMISPFGVNDSSLNLGA